MSYLGKKYFQTKSVDEIKDLHKSEILEILNTAVRLNYVESSFDYSKWIELFNYVTSQHYSIMSIDVDYEMLKYLQQELNKFTIKEPDITVANFDNITFDHDHYIFKLNELLEFSDDEIQRIGESKFWNKVQTICNYLTGWNGKSISNKSDLVEVIHEFDSNLNLLNKKYRIGCISTEEYYKSLLNIYKIHYYTKVVEDDAS